MATASTSLPQPSPLRAVLAQGVAIAQAPTHRARPLTSALPPQRG